jgi:8-oxo-dGTP diphosphatase
MFPNFALLLLINFNHEVLLLRRINTPFCNNCYSLPGGQIELGETARETLVREAKNGLGIDINPDDLKFVHVMHRKCNEPEFFACVFQADAWKGNLINGEPERHDDMQWFALDKLPQNMVPAHRHALELIQENSVYSEHGWQKQCKQKAFN